jgi:UDP-N-acetylglucosamine 4-epimerase
VSSPFEARMRELAAAPKAWLVTGAAGFVGSHLVETLLRYGQRVVALDNFSTGFRENLREFEGHFSMIEGDIRDFDTCARASAGVDYVLHQAALGSVPRSIAYPLDTHRTNVDGTVNVFLAALRNECKRVVYASSSSVYGDEPTLPKIEARTGRPLSPYAASKAAAELYADVYARTLGLSSAGLRYFNVVGARQDPNGPYAAVIPRWVTLLARGARPVLYGDGETSRDFCPVQNVVQANLLAATAEADLHGRAYNVALGGRTTLNQLFGLLRAGMAARGFDCARVEPDYQAFRPGDIRHSLADIGAAQRDLGYQPSTTLAEGLDKVMDFFASRLPSSASALT